MTRRVKGWVLFAALLVAGGELEAQRRIRSCCQAAGGGGGGGGSVLARLNCDQGGAIGSGAGWPTCNASSELNAGDNGTEYSKTQSANDGPQGQTAARWVMDARGTGEEYFGWNFNSMPAIPQGDKIYLRWMLYLNSPMQTGDFGVKLIIVGDADPHPDDQRIIVTLRQWDCGGSGNCYTFDVDRNIDGLGSQTGIILNNTFDDQWLRVQVEVDTSTTTSSGDGSIKVWLNTDTYASPTTDAVSESFTAGYAGPIGFGMFGNMTEGGSNTVYDTCCFEYATSSDTSGFDSNWQNGGSFWARSLTAADAWLLALHLPVYPMSQAERRLYRP